MVKLVAFVLASAGLVWVSWRSLRAPGSHGFFRFIAWELIVASFLLNCRFTYRVRPTWRRFLLFPLSTLANVGMTTFGVVAMVSWLGVDERIAPLIAGILAIPATFLVTRYLLVGRESRAA